MLNPEFLGGQSCLNLVPQIIPNVKDKEKMLLMLTAQNHLLQRCTNYGS